MKGERADYGKEILATLSQQLTQEYGNEFSGLSWVVSRLHSSGNSAAEN